MIKGVQLLAGETENDVVAIIPGEKVSSFNVSLPDLPLHKLEKILPGIMSDYLVGPIGNVHLSIIGKNSNGNALIGVCDTAMLTQIKQEVVKSGKMLKAIWPDYLLLAKPETGISFIIDDDRTLVRKADETGYVIPCVLHEKMNKEIQKQECSTLGVTPNGNGLATGAFNPRPPLSVYFHILKRLGILILSTFLLWAVYAGYNIFQNEAKRSQYADASIDVFKETYPDVSRIVNVEAQLKALTQNNGSDVGAGFLSFSDRLFETINQVPGIRLDSLNFDQSAEGSYMRITVSSSGYSNITVFETAMTSAGFSIAQGNSAQDGDTVFSDYEIREARR